MSDERFMVARLDEITRKGSGNNWTPIRAHFGIEAFGVNAWSGGPGDEVISDHNETPTGHQELYFVVTGRATFTVDGEDVDAPAGTLVFVGEPETQRKAVAAEPETTVLSVGAKPGEPYRPVGWEFSSEAIPFFGTGEYERAYEILSRANDEHPNLGGVLYNLACAEARLGKTDEAVEHLRRAVGTSERFREYAQSDPDLESIRTHPDFVTA